MIARLLNDDRWRVIDRGIYLTLPVEPTLLALAWAGILIGGARVWPGTWLGSFVVNIGTAFDATTATVSLTPIAIPTSIGVGATV